jgi:tetratricopeptide (TPR) repeat protein
MSFFGKWNPALLAAVLWLAAAGCSPMDQGPLDEEKEPHYVLGKSRVNAMDYSGAITAFEESLEANPHSAQSHYQLAMLFENQDSVADPAAAIYHYEQYLKYDPQAGNADLINQRIAACKQKLAADVLQLPSAPAAQQQLEKLLDENRRMHDQLAQWQAYYAAQQAAAKTNPPTPRNSYPAQPGAATQPQTSLTPDDVTPQAAGSTAVAATPVVSGSAPATVATATTTVAARRPAAARVSPARTRIVLRGETMASIARKQGVSLEALEEANPYVTPKKLKAGQVLVLPAP